MKRLVVAAALLAVLAGCKVRVEADTTVRADESGRFCFAVGFDEEFIRQIQMFAQAFGEEPPDLFEDFEEEAPPGWDTGRFRRGDTEGIRACRDFEDLDDLQAAFEESEEFAEAGEAGEPGTGDFDLRREGDRFVFTGTVDEEQFTSVAEEEPPFGMDAGPLELVFVFRLDLPGKVIDHNAHRRDGDALVWEFTLENPPTEDMRAVSDASQSEDDGFPVVPLVVGLIVAGALVGLLLARRRGIPPAPVGGVPDAADTGMPPGGTPGAPPPSQLEPPPPGPEAEPPPAPLPPPD